MKDFLSNALGFVLAGIPYFIGTCIACLLFCRIFAIDVDQVYTSMIIGCLSISYVFVTLKLWFQKKNK
jgi:hypothetical protein